MAHHNLWRAYDLISQPDKCALWWEWIRMLQDNNWAGVATGDVVSQQASQSILHVRTMMPHAFSPPVTHLIIMLCPQQSFVVLPWQKHLPQQQAHLSSFQARLPHGTPNGTQAAITFSGLFLRSFFYENRIGFVSGRKMLPHPLLIQTVCIRHIVLFPPCWSGINLYGGRTTTPTQHNKDTAWEPWYHMYAFQDSCVSEHESTGIKCISRFVCQCNEHESKGIKLVTMREAKTKCG